MAVLGETRGIYPGRTRTREASRRRSSELANFACGFDRARRGVMAVIRTAFSVRSAATKSFVKSGTAEESDRWEAGDP
jgi:hypothetical protein